MAQKWSGEPEIVTLPDVTVATVHTSGNPEGLGADVMKALYGAVYGLKFALKSGGTDDRTPGRVHRCQRVRDRGDARGVVPVATEREGAEDRDPVPRPARLR